MRIHFVRHADPDYARDGLTPHGARESAALAPVIAARHPTHLYVSELGRARQTATPIANATRLSPTVVPALNEYDWHVDVPGHGRLSAWDVPASIVRRHDRHPGVEAFATEIAEAHQACDRLFASHGLIRERGHYAIERRKDDVLVVVSHGGVMLTWISYLLGLPTGAFWHAVWFAPSSITTLRFEERERGWVSARCTALGDTHHLTASGLSRSSSGLYGPDAP